MHKSLSSDPCRWNMLPRLPFTYSLIRCDGAGGQGPQLCALHLGVEVPVPEVIDSAAGASEEHSSSAEERQHLDVWQAAGRRRQGYGPETGPGQQPCAFKKTTMYCRVSSSSSGIAMMQQVAERTCACTYGGMQAHEMRVRHHALRQHAIYKAERCCCCGGRGCCRDLVRRLVRRRRGGHLCRVRLFSGWLHVKL